MLFCPRKATPLYNFTKLLNRNEEFRNVKHIGESEQN